MKEATTSEDRSRGQRLPQIPCLTITQTKNSKFCSRLSPDLLPSEGCWFLLSKPQNPHDSLLKAGTHCPTLSPPPPTLPAPRTTRPDPDDTQVDDNTT